MVIDEVAEIVSFQIAPWTADQVVRLEPALVFEVEMAEMAADRPWGSLSRRLQLIDPWRVEVLSGVVRQGRGRTFLWRGNGPQVDLDAVRVSALPG